MFQKWICTTDNRGIYPYKFRHNHIQCYVWPVYSDCAVTAPHAEGENDDIARRLWEVSTDLVHLAKSETHPALRVWVSIERIAKDWGIPWIVSCLGNLRTARHPAAAKIATCSDFYYACRCRVPCPCQWNAFFFVKPLQCLPYAVCRVPYPHSGPIECRLLWLKQMDISSMFFLNSDKLIYIYARKYICISISVYDFKSVILDRFQSLSI